MSPKKLQRRSFTASLDPVTEAKVSAACMAYEAKNFSEALANLLPVASDPSAQCFLGMVYLDDPEQVAMQESGWSYLIASAEAGYEYAWHVLGNRYLRLEKNTYNLEQASRWFLKAAELGCLNSQYSLAWCYCKLNHFVAASKWLFVAVTLGNEDAASLCYSVQINMDPEDYELAKELAIEWLLLKRQGLSTNYYGPLRTYCNQTLVQAYSL